MPNSKLAALARLTLALLGVALWSASPATAATFCVHSPPDCSGTNQATLQDALDAADANGGNRDEIRIGGGLFSDGPAVDVAGNPVDLIGVAANQTAIRSSSTTANLVILDIQEPSSTVSDLRIHHNSAATPATGLVLAGDADRVLVTNQSASGQFDGVRLVDDGASFVDGGVTLLYPQDLQNRAVFVPAGYSPAIAGSYLQGTVGVLDGGETTILRTRIHATQGVVAGSGGDSTIRDSEIRVPGPLPANFQVAGLAAAGSGTTTIDAVRVTAHGDGTGYGAWVQPNGGAGNNASIDLEDSVLDGFASDVFLFEESSANATLTSLRSAYDSTKLTIGAGTIHTQGAGFINLAGKDPGFADPGAGNLYLLHDSPLIDNGDPNFQPMFIAFDVQLRVRPRDGDGDGSSVVDIGAHEYQRSKPLAVASAPAGGEVGQALTFDGSQSTDADEEPLSFQWSFDDGTEAVGAVVQKAFATPAAHTATLTVTDPAGVSDQAVATVTISPLANPPAEQALVLSGLRLAPSRFRVAAPRRAKGAMAARRTAVGTRILFTLSQAAGMTFTVHRRRPGRWVKLGAFTRSGEAGANSQRWGGRIGKRALKPGRYRLTARAGAGMDAQFSRARFKIVSGP